QGDRVLYIGKTINLAQRWATHNRLKQFSKKVGDIRVAWLECSNTTLLHKVEAALIEQFEPELNGGSLSGICPPRVTVTLSEEVHEELTKWAENEERTVANLLAYIATKAVKEHQEDFAAHQKSKKNE
ncbi:MAG: GIY-YIG nuclease family protein, partial [Richelia sp. SM1_7_0]|nr:GIY-YIG nuclease family protein [Richelia sp. SM1_7_0]